MSKQFMRKVFEIFSKKSAQVPSKVQRSSTKVGKFFNQQFIESRPKSGTKFHHSSDMLFAKDQNLYGKILRFSGESRTKFYQILGHS